MGLLRNIFGTHFKVVSPEKIKKQKEWEDTQKERDEYWSQKLASMKANPLHDFEDVFWNLHIKNFKTTEKNYKKEAISSLKDKFRYSTVNVQELTHNFDNVINLSEKELKQKAADFRKEYKFIKQTVNKFGSKKEIKLINEIDIELKEGLIPAYKDLLKRIEAKEASLKKQKSEVQSSSQPDANDPQKAEKLAKIAKLQRELDELKDELDEASDDAEPQLADKNN